MNIIDRIKTIWNTKWGRRMIICVASVIVLSLPMRCGGPYKGRIIDEDSGRPIAGALAVATWSTVRISSDFCLDAEETITDERGEFVIKGSRGRVFGLFTGTMMITVYKIGYEKVYCDWDCLDKPGACYMEPRGFKDGWAIFPLEKVAKDKMDSIGSPPHISCGRKDGKPLVEYIKTHKEYDRIMGFNQK